ncbi:MAG: hydroxyacid dehydrogenase [Flavobacteriia bacterium]|nr:hydroxyacid dehydrogenase [Flavobacteriia bacterium]
MKVLLLDRNHDLLENGLKNLGFEVDSDYESPKEEILKRISNYDGIIIRSRIPIDSEFLNAAVKLKFIGRVGAGLENIDLKAAEKNGVQTFNAPEGNRDSVGEHAVGMLLMLVHRLRIADGEVKNGIWRREENRGDELTGKTIGIIGYGNMGKAFAQRLKGFEANVICYDIKAGKGDENAVQVTWEEFIDRSEIISLHTPQTAETIGMFDKELIDSIKNPFYLINTARGKSVVTKDLVEGLKSGKIIGAALDVHEYEKKSFEKLDVSQLPEDFRYLIKSDNVILTPHIAGWTHQSKVKLAEIILSKIADWKKLHNIA